MSGTSIRFVDVSKSFATRDSEVQALKGVDLEIPAGTIYGVVGYSGAGKSTLIRLANALERPTSGSVYLGDLDLFALNGSALRAAKKQTGMIFQSFNLLSSRTVEDNVAEPLALDGVPRAKRRQKAREMLEFVGLAERAGSYPAQLSGGQKQRVGIARALVRHPSVLLCDEATSALDPTTTKQVTSLLRRINREYGVTILLVTHEMDVIKDTCEHVAVMEDGRVIEQGRVLDVFVQPREQTTRNFVRTVLPDGLPERLPPQFRSGRIWNLRLLGEEVGMPLMTALVREHGLEVNILYANMSWLQNQVIGQMSIEVNGDEDAVARARSFLIENNVIVQDA